MNAREAAYKSLLGSMREKQFISTFLETWQQSDNPSSKDFRFAKEIAYGATRKQKTLDHYAKQLVDTLKLKRKERALLYIALYQALEMDKVPLHAIVNESVELAKKECHVRFAGFLNAALKKIPHTEFRLPQGNDAESLSIRCSYTEFYVRQLLKEYNLQTTIAILEAGNTPGKTMGRIRQGPDSPSKVSPIENPKDYFESPDIYIQNITPVLLMEEMAKSLTKPPEKILDLAASPGGKALLAHDLYPRAKLAVNDVSEAKIQKIRDNFQKYGIDAAFSIGPGEMFSTEDRFDLIIVDAPCTNSGVLNKRPEARWRLNSCAVDELRSLQKKLIRHALELLTPHGRVFYMTCSILPCENQSLIKEEGLWGNCLSHKVILPNKDGRDGGFACSLSR